MRNREEDRLRKMPFLRYYWYMKEYLINLFWDEEASVWVATNDEIPIALESGSLDLLMERVRIATPELLELNGLTQPIS